MPVFFLNFSKELSYGYLGLKEMGKFLWEGRKKGLSCWLSQFSKTKLRQSIGQTFFPVFPKEFFPSRRSVKRCGLSKVVKTSVHENKEDIDFF